MFDIIPTLCGVLNTLVPLTLFIAFIEGLVQNYCNFLYKMR